MMTRTKMTAERKAERKAERDRMTTRLAELEAIRAPRLAEVHRAIADGRAYLDTFLGRRRVVSYSDASGNAITNNGTDWASQHTFMVCLESIKIDPAV